MEKMKFENAQVNSMSNDEEQFVELNDLQLAFVGGGSGDVTLS